MIKINQCSKTDVGLVRKANEDNLGFHESKWGPILCVCDGMGGHVGGATASRIAVDAILENISNSPEESPVVQIHNSIVVANKKILDAVVDNPALKGMGTTCTVMTVRDNGVYIGHVGDSRVYIFSDNILFRLTKDHSFVQSLVDSGVISDDQAESHARKNELTKALGVRPVVEPTVTTSPVKPKMGDIFMLCSDGLCGLVNDKTMEGILRTYPDLDTCSRELIEAAKRAGGHDNISVQLARVEESPFVMSSFVNMSPRETLTNTMSAPQQSIPPARTLKTFTFDYKLVLIGVLLLFSGFLSYNLFLRNSHPDEPNNEGNAGTEANGDNRYEGQSISTFKKEDGIYYQTITTTSRQLPYEKVEREFRRHTEVNEVDKENIGGLYDKVKQLINQGSILAWKVPNSDYGKNYRLTYVINYDNDKVFYLPQLPDVTKKTVIDNIDKMLSKENKKSDGELFSLDDKPGNVNQLDPNIVYYSSIISAAEKNKSNPPSIEENENKKREEEKRKREEEKKKKEEEKKKKDQEKKD